MLGIAPSCRSRVSSRGRHGYGGYIQKPFPVVCNMHAKFQSKLNIKTLANEFGILPDSFLFISNKSFYMLKLRLPKSATAVLAIRQKNNILFNVYYSINACVAKLFGRINQNAIEIT